MRDPIEVIEKGDKRAEIYYDDDPENPRTWEDGWVGTMVCMHRDYKLGDEQLKESDYESWDEVEDYLFKERNANIVLPLSLYDHSGITIRIGSGGGWDCGQVGFIYTTDEKCKKAFGEDYTRYKIIETLTNEVKIYDDYISGQVYGFKIFEKQHVVDKCPHCNEVLEESDEDVEIDSCWGFYGIKDVRDEVNGILGE